MKNILFIGLLLAGCQSTNKEQTTDQPANITINGKEYTGSVVVDSAGNRVRVKSGTARVSGSGNEIEIK